MGWHMLLQHFLIILVSSWWLFQLFHFSILLAMSPLTPSFVYFAKFLQGSFMVSSSFYVIGYVYIWNLVYMLTFFFPFRLLHQMGSLPIECTFLCPAFTHQYCILSNILIFAHLKYEECHYHFNFHFFDYEKMFHTFI